MSAFYHDPGGIQPEPLRKLLHLDSRFIQMKTRHLVDNSAKNNSQPA